MSAGPLGFWDYVKAAFHRRVRVPLLGAMPANKMAIGVFAVLGIANPGFWLLGAAGELAYLSFLASNERFQKLVNGERLMVAQRGWEDRIHGAVARLGADSQQRYRRLLAQSRAVLGLSEALDDDSLGSYRDMRSRNLNQMLWIFLRLLASREVIEENAARVDLGALDWEIEGLEARIRERDSEKDATLIRSLEGTLAIQRKRRENRSQAEDNLAVIDAELERIERQVELIREESAISGKPEALSARLDAVTTTMSDTNRWIDDHADFFASLAGDDDERAMVSLPSMPEALESE